MEQNNIEPAPMQLDLPLDFDASPDANSDSSVSSEVFDASPSAQASLDDEETPSLAAPAVMAES
jgi:hypothetical protein